MSPPRFRDRDGIEVDALIEHNDGRVIAVEVKAAEDIAEGDLRGLRHLARRLGDRYHAGVVVHLGRRTVRFGGRTWALPIAALWTGSDDA